MALYEIRPFILIGSQQSEFEQWYRSLRNTQAKVHILQRLNRIENGLLGDHKYCRDGIWELRIHTGSGYRIYYAHSGNTLIVLLAAGDKRSQQADISRACSNWRNWQTREA